MAYAPTWFAILKAARKLPQPFDARQLADAAGIPVETARPWLGKFCLWRYVERAGSKAGAKRWERLFRLTGWGHKVKAPTAPGPFPKKRTYPPA